MDANSLYRLAEWAVDALVCSNPLRFPASLVQSPPANRNQIAAGGVQNVTIPTCIEDGDYLLRFEIIALHSAYSLGGAQFYVLSSPLIISE
jgi:hypothetical protein